MNAVEVKTVRVCCPRCGAFLGRAGENPQFAPWCRKCRQIVVLDTTPKAD